MVVAGDEADAAQAAGHEAVEEAPPVDLGLKEGDGEAQHAALAVGVDPDRGEDGGIAHHAVDADLFVARVEEQVGEGAELAGAPGLELRIHENCGAADLGGREALEPELGHDLQDVARRHALPGNLGMYIWAMASMTARDERRPRSSACG